MEAVQEDSYQLFQKFLKIQKNLFEFIIEYTVYNLIMQYVLNKVNLITVAGYGAITDYFF